MTIDPGFVVANYVEAGVWCAMGAVTLVKGKGAASVVLAIALAAFGVSDIVETRTGAWYDPWWLLAWKIVCVVVILASGVVVWRTARRRCGKRRSAEHGTFRTTRAGAGGV